MLRSLVAAAVLGVQVGSAAATIPPNPIYDASAHTVHVANHPNGVLYNVAVPDAVPIRVLHVFGTPRERGEAHGHLLSAQLVDFIEHKMTDFFREYVASINLGGMPAWLQAAIRKLLLQPLSDVAPAVFELALSWVEEEQRAYNEASPAHIYDEMAGIAHGACAAAHPSAEEADAMQACEAKLHRAIVHVNMLPDLIRMQCSMLGASGTATPDGHLVQLRALDFGAGPFANNTILIVHHPEEAAADDSSGSAPPPGGAAGAAGAAGGRPPTIAAAPRAPFAAVSFPGFVGIATGFTPTLALSEKVNDIHGGGAPKGSYRGQGTALVIRDLLEQAQTKEEAHAIASNATRTWGVWLGLGDSASQRFLALEYMRASADAYDATSLPKLTGQAALQDVAFIDKHPQPSDNGAMRAAIVPMLGNITADRVAQNVPRLTQSGDVHIAVYDMSPAAPQVLISLGSTSKNGTYVGTGGRKAWAAPFVRFGTKALWAEARPKRAA